MGKRISQKTKFKEKRGSGSGKNYIPWIKVGEFGSTGTSSLIVDWNSKRQVHLLSQTEMHVYYLIKWLEPLDIKEQYPLDINITKSLATSLFIKHPHINGKDVVMTTDFLVELKNKSIAISVKSDYTWINSRRTKEKMLIEKMYWQKQGVEFKVITNEDINVLMAENIRTCSYFYDYEGDDDISIIKRLIIRKLIKVDIDKQLDFPRICHEYKKELDYIKGGFYEY